MSNGSIDPDDDVSRVIELQDTLEKQNNELSLSKERVTEMTLRVADLEEALAKTQKEVLRAQESATKFQRDVREVGVNNPPPPLQPSVVLKLVVLYKYRF